MSSADSALARLWFGNLPPGWEIRRFKYLGFVRNGQVDPVDIRFRSLPLYAPNHIEPGTGRLLDVESADDQGAASGKYPVGKGEIVYSKIRPALRKVIIAPMDGLCSADMYAIRPAPGVDARFLFWCMLCDGFNEAALLVSDRVAMPKVNRESLADFPLPLVEAGVQRAVAHFLDRKTATIDAVIEKKERLITLLAEKRAALIHRAVTKGLDHGAKMKNSGVPWIGEVPRHWEIKRIKYTCRLETGHTPSRSEPANWIEHECMIPWVSLNDTKAIASADIITDTAYQISERGMMNSSARLVDAGAVVFTRDATIGLAAIIARPMAVSQHIIAWVCGPEIVNRYLLRVIDAMTPELDRLTFGATIKTIGMGDVKRLLSPVPPLSEQEEIVKYLAEHLSKIEKVRHALLCQIDRLREYRQALITSAVTGKIDMEV